MTSNPKRAVGTRIELIHISDPWTNLVPGDKGTIEFIDDTGTIFVKWDNDKSKLGLVPGEDEWKEIS
jgi:hypothetical protein